jgi:hypothetical protein
MAEGGVQVGALSRNHGINTWRVVTWEHSEQLTLRATLVTLSIALHHEGFGKY